MSQNRLTSKIFLCFLVTFYCVQFHHRLKSNISNFNFQGISFQTFSFNIIYQINCAASNFDDKCGNELHLNELRNDNNLLIQIFWINFIRPLSFFLCGHLIRFAKKPTESATKQVYSPGARCSKTEPVDTDINWPRSWSDLIVFIYFERNLFVIYDLCCFMSPIFCLLCC